MLNHVMIIGRLGKDPVLRYAQNGSAVCNFSIATDESYKDRDGQKVEQTEWHNIVAFSKTAELCAQYLFKGSKACVTGKLKTRKWQDKDGIDRYSTEIHVERVVFLDSRQEQQETPRGQQGRTGGNRQISRRNDDLGPAFPSETSGMDDIPF